MEAKFGFFDLDAAVSSAFVFLLVESIYSTESSQSGKQGVKGATSILSYLSGCGNRAAQRRLNDVQQLCEHLHIMDESLIPPAGHSTQTITVPTTNRESHNSNTIDVATVGSSANVQAEQSHYTSPLLEDIDWRQALSSLEAQGDTSDIPAMNDGFISDMNAFDHLDGFNFDLNGDFMLTGADETDWAQFEHQISRQQ